MAKGTYIGIGDVARKIKKGYIGIDGVARKIKKMYIGVDNVARLFWSGGISPLYTGIVHAFYTPGSPSFGASHNPASGCFKVYSRSGTSITQNAVQPPASSYTANLSSSTYNEQANLNFSANGKVGFYQYQQYDGTNKNGIIILYTYNASASGKYNYTIIADSKSGNSTYTVDRLFQSAGVHTVDTNNRAQCADSYVFVNQEGDKCVFVSYISGKVVGILCDISGTTISYSKTICNLTLPTLTDVHASDNLETIAISSMYVYQNYTKGAYIYKRDDNYNYTQIFKSEVKTATSYAYDVFVSRDGRYVMLPDLSYGPGNSITNLYYVNGTSVTKTSFYLNSGYDITYTIKNQGSQTRDGKFLAIMVHQRPDASTYSGFFGQLVTDGATITSLGSGANHIDSVGYSDFSEKDDYCILAGTVYACSRSSNGGITRGATISTLTPSGYNPLCGRFIDPSF